MARTSASAGSVGRVDDQPAAGHGAHQVVELALDHREVVEDVRVVELQVVEHQGARAVVDELGALVEEGGVVLVRLHHEEGRGPSRAESPKLRGTPPIRKPGASPASSSTQASMLAVLVLPWVPATASTQRSRSRCSASHWGPEV
jgi:hypothetical protein